MSNEITGFNRFNRRFSNIFDNITSGEIGMCKDVSFSDFPGKLKYANFH